MCEMCENSIKPLETNESEQRGVLLGFWDQEKTTAIVEDLENSVTLIEGKCKKLLQELVYYQYYLEEMSNYSSSMTPCLKNRSTGRLKSTSVPDIPFRKATLQARGFERTFHDIFEKRLSTINVALSNAFKKIGLRENMFLFPTNDYLQKLEQSAVGDVEKYLARIKAEFVKCYLRGTVKSDLTLSKNAEKERITSGISKITKNELDFYKKLSNINLSKKKKNCKKFMKRKMMYSTTGRIAFVKFRKIHRRKAKGPGTRRFVTSTKTSDAVKFQRVSATDVGSISDSANTDKPPKLKKTKSTKSLRKRKVRSHQTPSANNDSINSGSSSVIANRISQISLEKSMRNNDLDIDTLCYNLVTALNKRHSLREGGKIPEISNNKNKTNLRSLVNKAIPFTTCKSTTKSHNLGMNVQQYISTKKQKRPGCKTNTSTKPSLFHVPLETTPPKLQQGQDIGELPKANSVNAQYIVTTYPWSPKESSSRNDNALDIDGTTNKTDFEQGNYEFTKSSNKRFQRSEVNRIERNDRGLPKKCPSNVERKFRSRYTKRTPEGFMGYHKSTMKQFSNGQESMIKSESKTAYAVGSKIMVSDCQRTDFYKVKKDNYCNNACGDSSFNIDCNRLKEDWARIFAMFSSLSKKYSTLKDATTINGQPDVVLKNFENEIDHAIEKYKEFLYCYSKFLQLKQQLKLMRISCDEQSRYNDSSIIFSASYENKTHYKKPTYTMVLKETLRQVQDLQDRIRVTDDV